MKKTILLILLASMYINAFAQPSCVLVCTQHVNASMPVDICVKNFEATDFVPNLQCEASVIITHPFGTNQDLDSNQVDRSTLGLTLIYQVESTTGEKCWGYVTIEDKSAPNGGCGDRTISCFEVSQINNAIESIKDNCSEKASGVISKISFEDFGCNGESHVLGIVHRTITTWDGWGNSTTCSDNLTIQKDELSQVSCPDVIALDCNVSCIKVNADGSIAETPTKFVFSSKAGDANYPTPQLLLDLQNKNKWRDAQINTVACLNPDPHAVPYLQAPHPGHALDFYGDDDYVSALMDVNEDEFTAEMWFKTTSPNVGIFSVSAGSLGNNGHDRHIYLAGGNVNVRVWYNETITSIGTNYADGQWHHVALVLGTSIGGDRLYLDGELAATGTKSTSDFNWQDRIHIGFSNDAANPNFKGTIDEVRIWKSARSQEQIKANMNKEISTHDDLQAAYHFNEGIDGGDNTALDFALDASGNGYHATLYNFSKTSTSSNWVNSDADIKRCIPLYPALGGYCKTTVNYNDEILKTCQSDGAFKIRRQWRIVDWCTGDEKVCVQYIEVQDTTVPKLANENGGTDPRDDRRYYRVFTSAHDCYATADLLQLVLDDCSNVTQEFTVSYPSSDHPEKIIVVNGTLPGKINLPPIPGIYGTRCFTIDVRLTDACYNRSNTTIQVCALDDTPPVPICDQDTRATVDPATCWARIYAVDLDNGSRDNCCDVLHFAVARMDSIDAARKYVIDAVVAQCGNASYWESKEYYDYYAEDYINSYIFSDYIDLTECGDTRVVLRVWEACGIPKYDPHRWPCSEHQWFMYNLGRFRSHYRADHNLNYGFSKNADYTLFKAPKNCNWRYPLIFCDPLLSVWFKQSGLDDNLPYYPGAADDDICNFNYYDPRSSDLKSSTYFGQNPPGNTCSRFNYSSCMVNVHVDDKTPPVCEGLQNLNFYCDGITTPFDKFLYAGTACIDDSYDHNFNYYFGDGKSDGIDNYKDVNTCKDKDGVSYGNVECVKENDGVLSDTLDGTGVKSFGWYGCSIYGPVHQDEHGVYVDQCTSNQLGDQSTAENGYGNSYAPIYCHTWLCLDRYDSPGKKTTPAFWTPKLISHQNGQEVVTPGTENGQFTLSDNCWIGTPTTKDTQFVDQCGNGWLSRTWTVTGKGACNTTSVSCTQKIYSYHRSDFEVMFPSDITLICDAAEDLSPTGVAGSPMIMDDDCELVGVNYTDVQYDIIPDACYKIIRTWTLIDWCKFDPDQNRRFAEVIVDDRAVASADRYCVYRKLKDNGDGYITYTQVIKVIDTTAPKVICKNDTVCYYGGYDGSTKAEGCSKEEYVGSNFKATDNCTASDKIVFRYELDLGNNGTIDRRSAPNVKNFASQNKELADGTHKLWVIASDKCGQEDTTSCLITVKDCKKPTPYCYDGIATVIMPKPIGTVTVWANDLNLGSYDNCTIKANLKYSFDADGKEASRTYKCGDALLGAGEKTVTIYVWDETGNKDFCYAHLSIQSNDPTCSGPAGSTARIAGKVMTEVNEPVENVTIASKASIPMPLYSTDLKGTFAFNDLPMNSDIALIPQRDDDPMNGVSTQDLLLIQKYLLGTEGLTSPYQLIAADIDGSHDISAVDLVELRKLILTVYDKLPSSPSWRFVPKSYSFTNNSNPLKDFPEEIDIKGLSKDELNTDFVGIKIGDVNGTALSHHLLGAESRGVVSTLRFRIKDQLLNAGDQTLISFTSDNFDQIEGYQFSIAFPDLDIIEIRRGVLNVSAGNFGMAKLNQGYITTSWNDGMQGNTITAHKDEVLFSILVKAKKSIRLSDVVTINSRYTHAEAYHHTENLGVILEVGAERLSSGENILYQNVPNPMSSFTWIKYELAEAEAISIKITDLTGRVVRVYHQDGKKGINQLKINRSDWNISGLLYYTLESKMYKATMKMIVID